MKYCTGDQICNKRFVSGIIGNAAPPNFGISTEDILHLLDQGPNSMEEQIFRGGI